MAFLLHARQVRQEQKEAEEKRAQSKGKRAQ